jgi:hypothetical protein
MLRKYLDIIEQLYWIVQTMYINIMLLLNLFNLFQYNLETKEEDLLRPHVYVPSTVITIDDEVYNNLGREKSVYLHLNKDYF